MPIYLISDLHGAPEDVHKAVPDSSVLLLLGDLINFIDYTTMTGILTEVFSVEAVERVIKLRAAGEMEAARRAMQERAAGREDEVRAEIAGLVEKQYSQVFASLPDPTYLILGNVDAPKVVERLIPSYGVRIVDGEVMILDGERFGFVGGGLPTPLHIAGEITEDEMRAKVDSLGVVDVLCSHVPPAVPELCFDTLAGRSEQGSRDLLRYIQDVQPRLAYFGHVHQPLVSAMHVGRTLCVNVGYFRATRRAVRHVPPEARASADISG